MLPIVPLPLCLNFITIRLVFRLELEVFVSRTQEHFTALISENSTVHKRSNIPDLDPIQIIRTSQQFFQFIPSLVSGWPIL